MSEKAIGKNIVFNLLYRIVNMAFPLVVTIYVSHVLLAEGVGRVGAAQNIVQYFVLLAPLGIANYGTREVARKRNNPEELNILFSELLMINFLSTTLCLITYYSITGFTNLFSNDKTLYLIAGLPIFFNYFNIEWLYEGFEDYGYIAIRNIIVKVFVVVSIIVFVKTKEDYLIYALIYALGIGSNYLLNILTVFRKRIKFSFKNIVPKKHLRPVFILLASNIAIELYTLLDTTMLNIICTDEIVGYYTNAIRLVRLVVSFISAIGGVLLPRLSYYISEQKKIESERLIHQIVKIMVFFALPCGVGVCLVAKPIVNVLFGDSFEPSILTLRIATGLIFFLGFSSLFGTQVLLSFNQEKKLLLCTLIGAISNIAMNSFMIPLYQHNGAAIASVISEALVTILTFIFASKCLKVVFDMSSTIKSVVACALMAPAIIAINLFLKNEIVVLLLSVISGATVYLLLGFLMKNTALLDIKKLFKKQQQP